MHLAVIYTDDSTLNSYFDSVKIMADGSLSVGNLTSGDGAGNWWEAPFDGRKLQSFTNTNCYAFYSPNNTCVSSRVPTVEDQLVQYNGTEYRDYPWLTGDEKYDNVSISKIQFWVRCAQCE